MAKQKTSLERSHSGKSNILLTLLCLFSALCFGLIFVFLGLGFSNKIVLIAYGTPLFWILIGASALLEVLCLILFNSFKR